MIAVTNGRGSMAVRAWYCKCGFKHTKRRRFVEHVALDNLALPLDERHWQVSYEEWVEIKSTERDC